MANKPQSKTAKGSQPSKAKGAVKSAKPKAKRPETNSFATKQSLKGPIDRESLASEIEQAMRAPKRSGPKPQKLGDALKQAAVLCGSGMKAVEAAERAGVHPNDISHLRYGKDPRSREFQRLEAEAQQLAIQAIFSKALGTIESLLDAPNGLVQVGAVREVNALMRNIAAASEAQAKLRIERERLQLQKDTAEQAQKQAETSPGVVFLPVKLAAPQPPEDV